MGWLSGWAKRIPITIDYTKVDDVLSQFPVLLKLSAASGITAKDITAIFTELGANSLKLAVTSDDAVTQLYAEVVSWDAVGKTAELWVSKSGWTISHTADTVIYLYYDNSQADNTSYVGVVGSTPGKAVWDANFVLVDHMNDNPNTSHTKDSTTNGYVGTKTAANQPLQSTGEIGKDQYFDGVDDTLTTNTPGNTANVTLEYLYKRIGLADAVNAWNSRLFSGASARWIVQHLDTTTPQLDVYNGTGYNTLNWPSATANEWNYYAATFSNGSQQLYKNATPGNSGTFGFATLSGPIIISTGNYKPEKEIDEVRLSNIARSAAWIKATYMTCWDTLVKYGEVNTSFPRTISTSVSMVSTLQRNVSYNRTLSTSIGMSVTLTRGQGTFNREISSSIGISPQLARSQTNNRTMTTMIGLSSKLFRVFEFTLTTSLGLLARKLTWGGKQHRKQSTGSVNRDNKYW